MSRSLAWLLGLLFMALLAEASANENTIQVRFQAAGGAALPSRLQDILQRADVARLLPLPGLSATERERLLLEAPAQLAEILATRGHLNARIRVLPREPDGKIVIEIDAGPATRVQTLRLRTEPAADREAQAWLEMARARWPLPVGATFDDELWREGKERLLAEARAAGYTQASVLVSEAMLDADTQQAELSLELALGPRAQLARLEVHGLHRLPVWVVEHLNPLRPAEPLTAEALARFEDRLQASQLFDRVTVSRGNTAETLGMLSVEVREASLHQVLLGLGYASIGGPRLLLEHRLLALPGLPAQARTRLAWAREDSSLTLDLLSWPLSEGMQALASWQYGRAELTGLTIDRRLARIGLDTRSRDEAQRRQLVLEWVDSAVRPPAGSLSARALLLRGSLTREEVDDRRFPTTGRSFSFEAGLGHVLDAPRASFVRLHARGSQFLPMAGGRFWQLRGELGQIFAPDTARIPQGVLFRAGGEGSVRGYGSDRLGEPGPGYVAGGRFLATASVEWAYPWREGLYGTLFVDAGGASRRGRDFRPVSALGLGVRWRSPLGALSGYLAWPEATRRIALGFSVGVRF